jgi:hypothetical protein
VARSALSPGVPALALAKLRVPSRRLFTLSQNKEPKISFDLARPSLSQIIGSVRGFFILVA